MIGALFGSLGQPRSAFFFFLSLLLELVDVSKVEQLSVSGVRQIFCVILRQIELRLGLGLFVLCEFVIVRIFLGFGGLPG